MRIKSIHFLFIIFFALLVFFLYYLQIIKGPLYQEMSYRNSIRLLSIDAPRGVIYDREGMVLADNSLSFGVFMVPQEVRDIDAEINMLSEILDVPESELERNYKTNYYAPFAPCELKKDISKRQAIRIEELKLDMPGVLVKEIPLRRYPYGEAFAHVVGYTGNIEKGELELLKSYGYKVNDIIGKDGVERVSDKILRGNNGGMQIQVDNRGRLVKILSSKKPQKGKDVYLTIDAKLQNFVWRMMKGQKGAAVFMDPSTGEVLTLVSMPSYDPNSSLVDTLYDIEAPLFNRAIMGQYSPGSLFKIVIALAGLDSEEIRPETTFVCQGSLKVGLDVFNCWNRDGHGPMDLENGIIESCNVYFYNLGILMGVDRISEYAKQFGFGKKTGIELFGESDGFVPTRSWKRTEKNENWYTGDTANLSIGQGYLLVTPLQIVRMVSMVATGGKLIQPHVLRDSRKSRTPAQTLKIKEENIEFIRRAMKGVVEDEDGTGALAWNRFVSIAAKTGTSQTGSDLGTHAWFAGFAPSEDPKISFVIFLEHGGSGGDMAALIARKAVEYWYRNR